ncbi:6-phosphogluconolactonase [Yoonia sp.]|uniref:6-phosphogluconolactonase n=1 Tax=Yoonia sp. TaxID=2212373 RepID=UPI001A020C46|nr:6-phosphogluconolactonase [Yoonia sp.]MBE0414842.1 6-phosphogluconolactonase [Yoonia sp.]
MQIIDYPDAEMMMIRLADLLASELRTALSMHDRVSIAVPGGTTPAPIFDSLCAVDLAWDRVHVMLTDERWVPTTDARSNTRLLREHLLTDRAAAAVYLPLYADAPTPEEKLGELAANIAPVLPLSVALLGMGADMHTASMFPEADQLERALSGDDILVAMRAPGAPEPRITLSAKVLNGAMNRHLVIVGLEKRAALEKARAVSAQEAPVAAILPGTTVHWAEQ